MQVGYCEEKWDNQNAIRVRVFSSLDEYVDQASAVDELFEEWRDQNRLYRCEVYFRVRDACHSSKDLKDLTREQNCV